MTTTQTITHFFDLITAELQTAQQWGQTFHSAHEAYAVILEELDEFWEIVRKKKPDRDSATQALQEIERIAEQTLTEERNTLAQRQREKRR